jgi:diguanylate cyclase
MSEPTPAGLARETLTRLASRGLAPTPHNYRRVYEEIAGTGAEVESPDAQLLVRALRLATPTTAARDGMLAALTRALREGDAAAASSWVLQLFEAAKDDVVEGRREWFRQLHLGLERLRELPALSDRQRKLLDPILATWNPSDARTLDNVAAWVEALYLEGGAAPVGVQRADFASPAAMQALRDALEQTLDIGVVARLSHLPDLAEEAHAVAQELHDAGAPERLDAALKRLKRLWYSLEMKGGSDTEIHGGMYRVLDLLLENVGELVVDDRHIAGQVKAVRDALAPPIDAAKLARAERSLRDAIIRQSNLKGGLEEAKGSLKTMVMTFIDRLGDLAGDTGGYGDLVDSYSFKLRQTDDMQEITALLTNLSGDMRVIQFDLQRSHDELKETRARAVGAEARIAQLERDLEAVSEKVREDQLTGSLNRRGLEEAFTRETARAERRGTTLALALLDIDHFKKLNDTLGHQAGDAALVHLVKVIKDTLRPLDTVARFGGEEFIILLPETDLAGGVKVMDRLQRALTRRFFLHHNDRVLITFSAGVAQMRRGENQESLIARADRAVYQAKAAGRNRVVTAE